MDLMSLTASSWALDICSACRVQQYAFAAFGNGNLAERLLSAITMRYSLLLSNT